jgi:dolichol-phosphate mannosyltransferase
MNKKILILIPVLNEVNNIKKIFIKIDKILLNNHYNLLFIDDNSSDGSKKILNKLKNENKNIFLLNRKKKLGIGSAHKEGINIGYKKNYDVIVTMDCDGTHNPIYIPTMLKLLEQNKYDIISTNRFIKKNSLEDWSIWRKYLTNFRHFIIKKLLKIDYDSSGAYRCYNVKSVKLSDILLAKNNSYSFFWESIFILSKKKYKIAEIPIILPGRLSGNSKMSIFDIFKALSYLIKFYLVKK